jgi:hypothetical protein
MISGVMAHRVRQTHRTSPVPKKYFFALAFRKPDRLCFEVLGLVGVNAYAVLQAADRSVRKKTP